MRRLSLSLILCWSIISVFASAQGKIKVACIGDSITYGAAIEDRENYSYPSQLQVLLGDGYEVGNFGKNGATLIKRSFRPYFDQKEFQEAMDFAGDICVIHLGVNDTDPRSWPNYRDDFVGDYLALIDSCKKANPKARIMIALLSPLADRHHRFMSGTKQWHEDIQKAIKVVAETAGCELIDFHTPLYPYPWHIPDAIHPDEVGYGMLAKTVYSAVTGDYGGLAVSELFSDNMVLQRRKPLTISGTANSGDKVTVKLGKKSLKTLTGTDGKWSVEFPPMEAASGLKMTISTKDKTFEYSNVAVGEVWLCSGQSNMRFRLSEAMGGSAAAASSDDPDLRFFDQDRYWPTNDVTWPESAIDSVKKNNRSSMRRVKNTHDRFLVLCRKKEETTIIIGSRKELPLPISSFHICHIFLPESLDLQVIFHGRPDQFHLLLFLRICRLKCCVNRGNDSIPEPSVSSAGQKDPRAISGPGMEGGWRGMD